MREVTVASAFADGGFEGILLQLFGDLIILGTAPSQERLVLRLKMTIVISAIEYASMSCSTSCPKGRSVSNVGDSIRTLSAGAGSPMKSAGAGVGMSFNAGWKTSNSTAEMNSASEEQQRELAALGR
jgi:hypothetical protein